MPGLTLFAAPAAEPITLAQAKTHLRVDGDDENTHIDALITAVRQHIEAAWDCTLVTTTLDFTLDKFLSGGEALDIPRRPLQSVTSIVYTDTNGDAQTWAAANYIVDTKSFVGRIVPAFGAVWPTARSIINPVTIRFVAGYGAAAAVPKSITAAMLLTIGHLYENREDTISGTIIASLPFAAENLLIAELGLRYGGYGEVAA